jgi:ribosomal protein S18 acetylase RimI-like enzyme
LRATALRQSYRYTGTQQQEEIIHAVGGEPSLVELFADIVGSMSGHTAPSVTDDSTEIAALVLARSFAEDPFYAWMLPDASTRTTALRAYFHDKLTSALRSPTTTTLLSPTGTSVLLAEQVSGDAPDSPPLTASARRILERWAPTAHVDEVEEVMAAIPHPSGSYAYLDVIGTIPDARGSGEGSTLARAWLASLDATQTVRLDSSNTANLTFYERLGFVRTRTVTLPHGAGTLTPMSRERTGS